MTKQKTTLTAEEKERQKAEKAEQKRLESIRVAIESAKKNVETLLSKYKDSFVLIRTEEEYSAYVDAAIKNGEITIDTETTGLNPYKDKIVGLCLFTDNQKEAYIPINHIDYRTGKRLDNQLDSDIIAKHLNKLALASTDVVMHNANFDIRILRRIGAYLKCTWDTSIAANILNENEIHKLKPLHQKYVLKDSEDEFTFAELFNTQDEEKEQKKNRITFDNIPIEIAAIYAAHDAKITKELKDFQYNAFTKQNRKDLHELYNLFMTIEMPCVDAVCNMEDAGFLIDMDYQEKLHTKYHKLLEDEKENLINELKKYNKEIIKWRSSKDANIRMPKRDIVFNFFYDSTEDLFNNLTKHKVSPVFSVTQENNKYKLSSDYGSITLDLESIKEGKQYKVPIKKGYSTKKVTASNTLQVKSIIESGSYEIPTSKSKAEQLPENIDEINLSSSTQLAIILYDIMKLKHSAKKEDARSTSEDALLTINNTFTKMILNYRSFSKMVDAFIDSLPEKRESDGKIHCKLNQYGTVTGRFSCENPNLQQIPAENKEIRKLFIAPTYYREVESSENNYIFKDTEEIEVSNDTWVFVKDLKVGDLIQDKKIKSINSINGNIEIEVE